MTLLDDLKLKQAELNARLSKCTDEKAYDLTAQELASVTKTVTITENRERARIAAESAAKHKAVLKEYNAELERIKKAKLEADALDVDLFEKIHQVYDMFSKAYETRQQITDATNLLKLRAKELILEEPATPTISVCNVQSLKPKGGFFLDVVEQYELASAQLVNSRRSGIKDLPDRPALAWFHRVTGGFVTSQLWSEPANPTPTASPAPRDVEKC